MKNLSLFLVLNFSNVYGLWNVICCPRFKLATFICFSILPFCNYIWCRKDVHSDNTDHFAEFSIFSFSNPYYAWIEWSVLSSDNILFILFVAFVPSLRWKCSIFGCEAGLLNFYINFTMFCFTSYINNWKLQLLTFWVSFYSFDFIVYIHKSWVRKPVSLQIYSECLYLVTYKIDIIFHYF